LNKVSSTKMVLSRESGDLEWIDHKIRAVQAKTSFLKKQKKGGKLKRLLSAQQQQ